MNVEMQNTLKQVIRGRLGACEMRFYDDSVTVTLVRDFGKFFKDDIVDEVTDILDNVEIGFVDLFKIEPISANRFKLRLVDPSQHVEDTIDLEADDDMDDTIGSIREAVDVAHEESMYEKATIKIIERDCEEFILTNLGSALMILGDSAKAISLDQTKELLRFAFISGLWRNARERDLEPLIKCFNGKFKQYADRWNMESNEPGHG